MDFLPSQVVGISETSSFRSWIDSSENFERFVQILRLLWAAQQHGPCFVTVEFRSSEERWPNHLLLEASKCYPRSIRPTSSKEDTPIDMFQFSTSRKPD